MQLGDDEPAVDLAAHLELLVAAVVLEQGGREAAERHGIAGSLRRGRDCRNVPEQPAGLLDRVLILGFAPAPESHGPRVPGIRLADERPPRRPLQGGPDELHPHHHAGRRRRCRLPHRGDRRGAPAGDWHGAEHHRGPDRLHAADQDRFTGPSLPGPDPLTPGSKIKGFPPWFALRDRWKCALRPPKRKAPHVLRSPPHRSLLVVPAAVVAFAGPASAATATPQPVVAPAATGVSSRGSS